MHDSEHEDWCAAVAAGDVGGLPAELVSAIERCPRCSPRLAELRALQATLARVGGEERELVEAARALGPAQGEVEIARRLRELAAPLPAGGATPLRAGAWRRRGFALAATLLVAFAGMQVWRAWTPRPADIVLGDDEIEYLTPIGFVDAVSAFEWLCRPLEPGGYFEVTVRAAGAPEKPRVVSSRLSEPRWVPTPDELRRIEHELSRCEWNVQVYDASGGGQRTGRWVPFSFSR